MSCRLHAYCKAETGLSYMLTKEPRSSSARYPPDSFMACLTCRSGIMQGVIHSSWCVRLHGSFLTAQRGVNSMETEGKGCNRCKARVPGVTDKLEARQGPVVAARETHEIVVRCAGKKVSGAGSAGLPECSKDS